MTALLLRKLARRSYMYGNTVLASGKWSDFYLDCKQTFLTRDGLLDTVEAFGYRLRSLEIDEKWKRPAFIAGSGVGGGQVAPALVLWSHTNKPSFEPLYVRTEAKGHGTKQLVEPGLYNGYAQACGDPLQKVPYGEMDFDNVSAATVLVEDVITTGGSAIRAAKALREAGYEVEGVLALVDRLEGGREAIEAEGLKFSSIYTKEDVLRQYQLEITGRA